MRIASLATSAVLAAGVLAVTAGQGQAAPVTRACSTADVKLTVQNVPHPLGHQLLAATNTGRTACNAYLHPYLGFDDDQSVTRVVEESKPQAVVTLAPGESAYAGIRLYAPDGSGHDGRTVRTLRVFLDNGHGPADGRAKVTLPKGTYIDDTAAVTYWQSDADTALDW
ncbi:DUF4232 domain-containing protein [Streptomyces sp. AV19]|uniref:DUF4232 domain-containing protein n=1 Tax=Streptomyces sp. AV19 TaxID=2793068 RepID=UPI0018FEF97A|nr:DUF4232 domain-containing protein [Streptomyces sp. AV19]MBH1934638.1 DUF4232 domain-containing protein [Streptomyces sp. AV19]MDG4530826.1 DUF4232 domain-containing protein [Streptomyces sp. AV19]